MKNRLVALIIFCMALVFGFLLTLVILLVMYRCGIYTFGPKKELAIQNAPVFIPARSDWTDRGTIIRSGSTGTWDHILGGTIAGSVVKKNGVYYFYYVGSPNYDDACGSVAYRAIGVATSTDGLHWTKYAGNPVLTWAQYGGVEEGIFSAAAFLEDNGETAIYYGAVSGPACTVNTNVRLATSPDGFNFTDQGLILSRSDPAVWGSGDELASVISIHDAGKYIAYYIPGGTPQRQKLGVAWGDNRSSLVNTSAATSSGALITAWGSGGSAEIAPDTYALFLGYEPTRTFEVRTMSLSAPDQLSAPVVTYQFSNISQYTVFLDRDISTWFMLYRSGDTWGVMTAPAIVAATSTPTTTVTPSFTLTASLTQTSTPIPTNTPSLTPTSTPINEPTDTQTPTDTPLPTDTQTPTDTALPTDTPLPTDTQTPTFTPLPTDTETPTFTPLPTDTQTPTSLPSPSLTPLPTNTPLPTYTLVPTYTSRPTNTPLPSATPLPLVTSPVFQGEYFANKNLMGRPVLIRDDNGINFDWGLGSPDSFVPPNNFSIRWTRQEYFDGGVYVFTVWSDDGLRIYIDNQLVYDRWRNQPAKLNYFNLSIPAGSHSIKVEYYEARGKASVGVVWGNY